MQPQPEAKGPKIVAECEAKGEPYFVLRAKDIFALETITEYLMKVQRRAPDNAEYVEGVVDQIARMGDWRANHSGEVRYPD